MEGERRFSARQPISQEISFTCVSCGTPDEHRGRAVNISENGASIMTPHEVATGQVIRILRGIFSDQPQYGYITWTGRSGSLFAAGVKFVGDDVLRNKGPFESAR